MEWTVVAIVVGLAASMATFTIATNTLSDILGIFEMVEEEDAAQNDTSVGD